MTGPMATRLSGSSDLYQPSGRRPYHSINFITSHDGYTLNDLVSYERKHNLDNHEDNRDGDNNNNSCNYGVEGPTRRKSIVDLRHRQAKNFMASLLLSQGVPMILAGDEVLRTQRGNNNAYCQDNAISWFDWRLVETQRRDAPLRASARSRSAAASRTSAAARSSPAKPRSRANCPTSAGTTPMASRSNWHANGPSLTSVFGTSGLDRPGRPRRDDHAPRRPRAAAVRRRRQPPANINWRLFVDTAAEPPDDIYPDADGPAPGKEPVVLESHTLRCYVAE